MLKWVRLFICDGVCNWLRRYDVMIDFGLTALPYPMVLTNAGVSGR